MKTLSPTLNQSYQSDDPKAITKSMGKSKTAVKTSRFTWVAAIVFLICFGAVAQYSTPLDTELISAATALTIITASAVGIERAIETFWTYIGCTCREPYVNREIRLL